MKLSDYIDGANLTRAEFAALIDVDEASLSRYISGSRRPNWDVLHRIRDATGGRVTANDFMNETVEEGDGAAKPRAA